LYPDGCIQSAGETDEFRVERNEDELFQKLLWGVPQPTFWERTRSGRSKFEAWIFIGSVIIGSPLLVFAVMRLFGFK
jgi:hypothetical protein